MCIFQFWLKKNRCWPLCVFCGILNIFINNDWIIYSSCPENRKKDKYDFTPDLSFKLCRPWAIALIYERGIYLLYELRDQLKSTFHINYAPPTDEPTIVAPDPYPAPLPSQNSVIYLLSNVLGMMYRRF